MQAHIIESPRLGYTHVGIRFTDPFGRTCVYANSPGRGVIRQSERAFCAGQPIRIVRESAASIWDIDRRLTEIQGRRYYALTWNCEHFIGWAEGKQPSSPQVQAYVALAALGLMILAGSRSA